MTLLKYLGLSIGRTENLMAGDSWKYVKNSLPSTPVAYHQVSLESDNLSVVAQGR